MNWVISHWLKLSIAALIIVIIWLAYIIFTPRVIRNDEDVMEVFDEKAEFVRSLDPETGYMLKKLKPDAALALKKGRSKVSQSDVVFATAAIGSVEIAKYLVNKGFDFKSERPLKYAAFAGHEDMCRYLLDLGAPVKPSLMFHAVSSGNKNVCELVAQTGVKYDPTKILARLCRLSDKEYQYNHFLYQSSREEKIDLNKWKKSMVSTAKFLIENGANPNDSTVQKALKDSGNPFLVEYIRSVGK